MTRFGGSRPALWVVMAIVLLVSIASVTFFTLGNRRTAQPSNDCAVVTDLVRQWTTSVGTAQTKLATSDNGHDDTLALADSEADAAIKIRAAAKGVQSEKIVDDLNQWASGAEQLAKSRRDETAHPNPAVTAPPPADYIQGSEAIQTATSDLLKVCPSAHPGPANA
jgi:hypothetical protein